MATFTNATVLGINASSQFLGNETVRLRTVKAIDVEGFIDSRATNTDIEGVEETQNTISALIGTLNNAKTETEEIIINGYNFGTGKIISANFPSAPGGATDNQILLGKWSASLEVYESGNSELITGAFDQLAIPNSNFLQDFSESFSASRGEDNSYDFSHDVSLKYISGLQPAAGGGSEKINPINGAKTLAQSIFSQTLTSFNLSLGIDSSYDYSSVAQNFFNETYDLENGTANFQKRFSLFNTESTAGQTNYSAQITTAFEMGDDGVAKVTERGEIKGRDPLPKNIMTKSLEAHQSLLSSSYTRCNAVYNTYKSYLSTPPTLPWLKANRSSLVNSIVSQSKSVNINAGTVSYDVSYTDENNIKNIDRIEDKTIDLSTDGNITTVSEKGTITVRYSKFSQAPASIIAKLPSSASVKTRCSDVYAKTKRTGSLRLLKNTSSYAAASFSTAFARGGKTLEYSYEFTDDPEVIASPATFTKKQIKTADAIGVVNTKVIMFPNQPGHQAYVQWPGQTSVSTRTVTADAQMLRATTNNLTAFREFKTASREIFQDMLLKALEFFQDNPSFTTIDKSQVYVSDISFNFDNENKLGGTLSLTIVGSRNEADLRKIL